MKNRSMYFKNNFYFVLQFRLDGDFVLKSKHAELMFFKVRIKRIGDRGLSHL